MAKEPLGVTFVVPPGVEPLPIYQAEDGIEAFETDDPYLLSNGTSLEAPIPVVDAGGPIGTSSVGNPVSALMVSLGGGPDPEPVNLIVNGDFATDTAWDKGDGWTIAGGVAVGAPAAVVADLSQPVIGAAGLYKVKFDVVTRTAGQVFFRINTQNGAARTTTGSFEEDITIAAPFTAFSIRKNLTFNGSIDNVELYYLGP